MISGIGPEQMVEWSSHYMDGGRLRMRRFKGYQEFIFGQNSMKQLLYPSRDLNR